MNFFFIYALPLKIWSQMQGASLHENWNKYDFQQFHLHDCENS